MEERNYKIDALKFFCILGVVIIHTTPFKDIDLGFKGSGYISIIIMTLCRVCVPIFFICSGYFFVDKCNKEYVLKYIKRILFILIIWSIIYIIFNLIILIINNTNNSKDILIDIYNYFRGINISDIYYGRGIIKIHLWYLSTLIIVIPILYIVIKNNFLNIVLIITMINNIIGVCIPVFINPRLSYIVRDAIFFGMFYCTLGAYIKENETEIIKKTEKLSLKNHIKLIIILFIVMIIERIVYLLLFNGGGDYFISTIPLCIFIFLICLREGDLFKDSYISKLGTKTLGVYTSHILIIDIILLILEKSNNIYITQTIIWQVMFPILVILLSYILFS